MKVADFRLVLIEWQDTVGYEAHWQPLKTEKAGAPLICKSVGWIIDESPDSVLVVPHVHDADDRLRTEFSGSGHALIPRAAVVSMVDLMPKPKRERR